MGKICKKCGEDKPLERFGKTNRNVDGYNGSCKDCITNDEKKRKIGIIRGTYTRRKITKVDDTFFENVDTESKAYWLGFLYADGYVRKKHMGGQLKLKLKQTDKTHIEKFKSDIKSEHIIVDGVEYLKKNNKTYISHYSVLNVYNLKMVNDLFNLGCVECKTQNIRFPNISSDLVHHFIRGYFDGDGCIHKRKSLPNSFTISIVSNQFFCQGLIDFINMGITSKFENYSVISINKINDVKKFRDLIYKNATIFLERKKDIFNTIDDNFKRDYDLTQNKKSYVLTTPEGKEIITHHLSKFCKENGLVYSTISNLSRGIGKTCKKWKCRIYNINN